MRAKYRIEMQTPHVEAAQLKAFGRVGPVPSVQADEANLGEDIRMFITARDSFYLATSSAGGWPYLQHRGGECGFLKVIGQSRLGFLDKPGNRQLISAGNIEETKKTSLFLMDYVARERLKIIGNASVVELRDAPELAAAFEEDGELDPRQRIFIIDVVGYDWNCPKYINPRYTKKEVNAVIEPLKQRIADLEAQLAKKNIRS